MPGPYYNQNYDSNLLAMTQLLAACVEPAIDTHSGLKLPRLPFSALGALSKGALQDMVRNMAKGVFPGSAKGVHRNEWGYLPGNRYAVHATDSNRLTTQLYGEDIPVLKSACQFQEYYFDDGEDLKMGKNADRRIVYDQEKKHIYLTMVHYDRWVKGTRNADGSPKGGATVHNPFLRIADIP
jgi:hypothetical protein